MTEKIDPEVLQQIEKYPESYRWQLVEAFRKRSDEAANYLRALLLAISTAALGFLFNSNYEKPLNWHHLSILFLGVSVVFMIWSWDRQKTKSIGRLMVLRDEGYEQYLNYEKCLAKFRRNETLDRMSYGFIAAAAWVEAVVILVRKSS